MKTPRNLELLQKIGPLDTLLPWVWLSSWFWYGCSPDHFSSWVNRLRGRKLETTKQVKTKKENHEQRNRHGTPGRRYRIDHLRFQCVRLGKFGRVAHFHGRANGQNHVVAAGRQRVGDCRCGDGISALRQDLNESTRVHAKCKTLCVLQIAGSCLPALYLKKNYFKYG